ncbi:MAG TPA: KH domain-containing protein [Candidatus Saccharimonadales bacterium]|nr:KH domain-containing protein [Candidatus Saccharimonadales bacterium]
MDDLLKLLVEPLVTDINEVKIEKQEDGNNILFTMMIPQTDIAKVIGKGGKMIKSIKNLLKIRAIKENVFANLEVKEA